MTRIVRSFLALAILATPVAAQTPMTADEFEAFVEGRSLYYELGGVAYGIEEYRPNRQVRWSFLDGECKLGSWYEDGGQICFGYEDRETPQCWTFYRDGAGLEARFENDPPDAALYGTRVTDTKLECLGPDLGT